MSICFGEPQLDARRVQAKIPARVESKTELLALLEEGLGFPDYFGANWDALEECLGDLSWLEPEQVVIRHEGVPLPKDREAAATYLSILADSIAFWEDRPEHSLVVVFPAESEKQVEDLIG